MNFGIQISNMIQTVVFGLICVIAWKCIMFILFYFDFRKTLRRVPTTDPHWLLGNIREGQITNSQTYIQFVQKLVEKKHKVICAWVGPVPVISVIHSDTFKELNKQTIAKARGYIDAYRYVEPWIGEGLLVSGETKWERSRKLLTPAFHFDILNGYAQIMNETVDIFLDKVGESTLKQQYIDIYPQVCLTTLDTMLKCSLSYEGNIQNNSTEEELEYINAVRRLSEIIWERTVKLHLLVDTIFHLSSVGKEFIKQADLSHKFTRRIIESRKNKLGQKPIDILSKHRKLDFLDVLLTAKDDDGNGLTSQEIEDEVNTFTFEGHDTTASAISWAIYALGKYPDIQHKVYDDVKLVMGEDKDVTSVHLGQFKYLPLFIKEILRYYSPVPIIGRRSNKPIVLDGYKIPVGTSVYVQIYSIHHNEDIWPNNMVFNPDRFNMENRDGTDLYGFIPFSAGSRNCIGQVFAMNEIKICLAKTVKRFEVKLDPNHEPVLLPDITMRTENGILVTFIPRK